MELVEFGELKKLLHLEKDSISDYGALEVIANSVYFAFESYLQRYLEQDSYVEEFDAEDVYHVFALKALPIKKIKEVKVDGQVVTPGYRIRTDCLEMGISHGLVTIKYSGGFEELPGDIKRAALLQIAYEYQRHDHIGATSVSTDGGSVRTPALSLLSEVKRILQKYRNYAAIGI